MSIDKSLIHLNLIPGIGSKTIQDLLQAFESAEQVLALTASEIKNIETEINQSVLQRIVYEKSRVLIDREMELIQKHDCEVITLTDPVYPALLKEIADPPPILYLKGNLPAKDLPWLSIVGTREPTTYGQKVSYELACQCAKQGMTIVSGGARGIDAAAHRGALETNGTTIAVMGCGLSRTYPVENRDLLAQIVQDGAVISEFSMATKPKATNFPRRNRLISGLSEGTVVVEASERSGSLITARLAAEQGREVFTVPGQIWSRVSISTHRLTNQGATLVHAVEDILDALPSSQPMSAPPSASPQYTTGSTDPTNRRLDWEQASSDIEERSRKAEEPVTVDAVPPTESLSVEETLILSAISGTESTEIHIDQIARVTVLPVHKISSTLTLLELKGLVEQLPGKHFKHAFDANRGE